MSDSFFTGPRGNAPRASSNPARAWLLAYMAACKKWWLLPIVLVLVMFGGLLPLPQGSALAPFIYTVLAGRGYEASGLGLLWFGGGCAYWLPRAG